MTESVDFAKLLKQRAGDEPPSARVDEDGDGIQILVDAIDNRDAASSELLPIVQLLLEQPDRLP